jgi:hypothetical protein
MLRRSLFGKDKSNEKKFNTTSQISPKLEPLKLNDRLVNTFLRLSQTYDSSRSMATDIRSSVQYSRRDSILTPTDIDELMNSDLEISDKDAIMFLFYIDFSNIRNMRNSFSLSKNVTIGHSFGFLVLDLLVKYLDGADDNSFPDKETERVIFANLDSLIQSLHSNDFIKERYGTFVGFSNKIHRRDAAIAPKVKEALRPAPHFRKSNY